MGDGIGAGGMASALFRGGNGRAPAVFYAVLCTSSRLIISAIYPADALSLLVASWRRGGMAGAHPFCLERHCRCCWYLPVTGGGGMQAL